MNKLFLKIMHHNDAFNENVDFENWYAEHDKLLLEYDKKYMICGHKLRNEKYINTKNIKIY